jgi:Beta-catenin-interacting protein ICAT
MFAQKQPDQLRKRFAVLAREFKLKHLTAEQYQSQGVEVLIALKKLGSDLTPEEQRFLDNVSSARHLESAVDKLGSGAQQDLISTASSQIQKANV